MLLHYSLGHPNFMYLERMFSSLFVNKDAKLFTCDVFQISKHTHSMYVPRAYIPSQPFAKIHSDIWRVSRVSNISGAC